MRAGGLSRSKPFWMLVVAVIATGIAIVAYSLDGFRSLGLNSVDARFSVRGTQPTPDDLVVVAIDDATFRNLGLQWPFPRATHARVIDQLNEAGVKNIAFDVQFTEPTQIQ